MTSLTTEQAAFLDEPRFAVVATVARDGMPHLTVMWYIRDGAELLLSTPQDSLKHKHLRRDQRMVVCVEDGFRYVTVSGQARIDTSTPEAARALYGQIGSRYMRQGPRPDVSQLDPKAAELLSRERVTLRLAIDHVHSNGLG